MDIDDMWDDEEDRATAGLFKRVPAPSAIEAPACIAAPGWQTIETAPKDGTRVDLWCINHLHYAKAGERFCNVAWGRVTDFMGREREDWKHGHGEDLQPTHWMPLPAAPEVL